MDLSASSSKKLVVSKNEPKEPRIKCKTNLVKKPAPATPSLTQSLRTIRKRRTNRLLQASLDSMLVHSRSNDASKIENNSSALQSSTNNFFQVARQRIDLFTEKEMEEATDRLGEYLLSTLSQQWLELYTGEEMQQATDRLQEYLASTLRGISLEEWVAILFGGQCGAL